MTSVRFLSLALLLGVSLAACGPAPSGGGSAAQAVPPTVVPPAPAQDLARTDGQGAVTVAVTPLDLNNAGQTLDFEVAMNTHSVNLGMDLATLATLSADTGRTVRATAWDGPKGGHHVSGRLSFAAGVDGVPLLKGAKKLTLTLQNVDAPERTFTWDVPGQ
jgi:hypothetical protein